MANPVSPELVAQLAQQGLILPELAEQRAPTVEQAVQQAMPDLNPPVPMASSPVPFADVPVQIPAPEVGFQPMVHDAALDYTNVAGSQAMQNSNAPLNAESANETTITSAPDLSVEHAAIDQVADEKQAAADTQARSQQKQAARSQLRDDQIVSQLEAQAQKAVKQQDEAAVQSIGQILKEGSNAERFAAILAVLAGGISQGLTGSRENPALAAFDKMIEQESEKRKLSLAQQESLRKAGIEQIKLKLEQESAKTDDAYKKAQIIKIYAELNNRQVEAGIKQASEKTKAEYYAGTPIPDSELANLSPEEKKSIVRIKGQNFLTTSRDNAVAFKREAQPLQTALAKLKKYQPYIEQGKWANLLEKGPFGSMKMSAEAETLSTVIAGALRMPITGPGALTDSEREMLKNAIGTYGLFKLPSAEAAKVKLLIKDLEAQHQNLADTYGVRAQVNDRTYIPTADGRLIELEDLVNNMSKQPRFSGLSQDKIRQLILQQANLKRGQ